MSLDGLAALALEPGIPPLLVYTLLFVGCVLESFFPPWPADLIALYAGFLAARGQLTPAVVLVAAVLGTQTGVMIAFWLGRRWGRALFAGWLGRRLHVERMARLDEWFARYGASAIAVSRFLPGIRALVTPAAGMAGFAAWKVLVCAGLSVIVWNVLVIGLGFTAGRQLEFATQLLARYSTVAPLLLLVVLVVGWLLIAVSRCGRRGRSLP